MRRNPENLPQSWTDFKKWWVKSDRSVRNSDAVQLYDQHPLISATTQINDSAIGVIDIKTMQYIYLSPNFGDFIGGKNEEFFKGGVEFVFGRIPAEDQGGLILFSEIINETFRKLPDSEKPFYMVLWDFQLAREDGHLAKILQQDSVLKYDTEGKIDEFLLIATKIGGFISPHSQHLRVSAGNDVSFYKYDHKTKKTTQLELLSKRELEIARLIAKSNTLKEIGVLLNISFNTVKVHSANMLRKMDVTDSIELVNLLRSWKFI